MSTPRFSIVHASARPQKWQESFQAWMAAASRKDWIEYILTVDQPAAAPFLLSTSITDIDALAINKDRECCVDAYNAGAKRATGQIIILNSDDMFPPQNWDLLLDERIPPTSVDFVVRVDAGSLPLITLQILSRPRYRSLGYALHPSYISVYADNEFTEHAERDGCVIEATDLKFEHRHPTLDGPNAWQYDDVYRHENSRTAVHHGHHNLIDRRYRGFPPEA